MTIRRQQTRILTQIHIHQSSRKSVNESRVQVIEVVNMLTPSEKLLGYVKQCPRNSAIWQKL